MLSLLHHVLMGHPSRYNGMTPVHRDRMRIVIASCRLAVLSLASLSLMRLYDWQIGMPMMIVILLGIVGLQFWIMKTQNVRTGTHIFLFLSLSLCVVGMWNRGGINSPVGYVTLLLTWVAIRSNDRKDGLFWCLVIFGVLAGLQIADSLNLVPPDKIPIEKRLVYSSQVLLLMFPTLFCLTYLAEYMRSLDLEEMDVQRKTLRIIQQDKVYLEMQGNLNRLEHLASIGRLAAGTAHEINNPLSYVIGNVELILTDLKKSPSDWTQSIEAAEDVLKGAQNIQQVVKDLNTFTKDDERFIAVEIDTVLEETLKIAMNEIRHRALVHKEFEELPFVLGSMTRLGQVFLNLLLNAAHAIPPGDASKHAIRIRTFRHSRNRIGVEIHDSGKGIEIENLMRIRKPFFTTKAEGEGSGLGLSVTENILQALGGELLIQSTVGVGTKVTVLLPIATPENVETPVFSPPRERAPVSQSENTPLKILIIDDDPLVARVLNRALNAHRVSVCIDGQKAKQILDSKVDYDLILCDLMMPNTTGMDVHQHVQNTCPHLLSTMVFISGGTFTQRARDFIASDEIKVLSKPIQMQNLMNLVKQVHSGANKDARASLKTDPHLRTVSTVQGASTKLNQTR